MFRHTFITNCYQQKIDTRILTDIVGHTNSKMTNHYTHPECEFMHREFKKYEDLL
ncbi:tyrosine-type recombinase/integrase [Faecalimonas umbilicata]